MKLDNHEMTVAHDASSHIIVKAIWSILYLRLKDFAATNGSTGSRLTYHAVHYPIAGYQKLY